MNKNILYIALCATILFNVNAVSTMNISSTSLQQPPLQTDEGFDEPDGNIYIIQSPYTIDVTYTNGDRGFIGGYLQAQEAINILNRLSNNHPQATSVINEAINALTPFIDIPPQDMNQKITITLHIDNGDTSSWYQRLLHLVY